MSKVKYVLKHNSKSKNEKKKNDQSAKNIGIAAIESKNIQRYGSAVKVHLVGYEGVDRESGQVLKKGLKTISENKINPNYQEQNIMQQAGFAAEVKTVARENAEKIISGDSSRSIRTDDLVRQNTSNGQVIGGVNDQLFDVAFVDKNGMYIDGTARQLKYIGSDPKSCCEKLLSSDYDKYRNENVTIEIKKEFYNDVQNELSNKIESLNQQIQYAEKQGNYDLAEKYYSQLERAKKTKTNLKEGLLTSDEAVEARLYPGLSTAKDVVRLSHRSGVEGAKSGAIVGGGISCIRNIVSVVKGDETAEEATANMVVDVGKSAASGYAIGFMGSGIKGAMQNSSSTLLREFSNTSLPGVVAVGILETGKTLFRLAEGQINIDECFIELGEKGVGITASTIGSTIGQIAIPIPVVGAAVGGIVGYALSTSYYNKLITYLKDKELAHEERMRIQEECKETIEEIKHYHSEIERLSAAYFKDCINTFTTALKTIEDGLIADNADDIVKGANMITEKLGGVVQYNNMDEFEVFMNDSNMDFIL